MNSEKKYTVALSGSTGFVGTRLSEVFLAQGWDVIPLVRKDFESGSRHLCEKLKGADAIVNLAGAPIINRWTPEYKEVLYDSRIRVTEKLVEAIEELEVKPEVLVSTSAIGLYDDQGHHTESDFVKADTFLGNLAFLWENAAMKAEALGVRTVIFRLGVVLGKQGGALKQMLLPFKLGLGGPIGNGKQHFSWIHIEDLVQAYLEAISTSSFEGTYNLTSPNPTTNMGLTKALGKVLGRPTFFRVPALALKLQFGEGATVLTGGQHVSPKRLLEAGFRFRFPALEEALQDCVSRQ